MLAYIIISGILLLGILGYGLKKYISSFYGILGIESGTVTLESIERTQRYTTSDNIRKIKVSGNKIIDLEDKYNVARVCGNDMPGYKDGSLVLYEIPSSIFNRHDYPFLGIIKEGDDIILYDTIEDIPGHYRVVYILRHLVTINQSEGDNLLEDYQETTLTVSWGKDNIEILDITRVIGVVKYKS